MLLNNVNEVNSLIAQLTQYRDQLAAGAQTQEPTSTDFTSLFADLTTDSVSDDPLKIPSVTKEIPPVNYLLDDEANVGVGRPNMAEFVKSTGASAWDASEALYGTVGSNRDMRDWAKIMASEDPLAASRMATRQLYEAHGSDIAQEDTSLKFTLKTIANHGALEMVEDGSKNRVYMTDKDGNRVREMGGTDAQMKKNAIAFGVEKDLPILLNRFLGLS